MNNGELPGLYIHTPFCRSKCIYCDFYSVASRTMVPAWLEAIRAEMKLYGKDFPVFDTLFLGGGTPSVLEERELALLFESIRKHFSFGPDAEMTMEANPESLSKEKLDAVARFGVNRMSLGVQSLDDTDLQYLGRAHDGARALRALRECREAGFGNVSVDLIYGLETQTLASWKKTLDLLLEFRPEHISCYELTFSPSTPLGKRKESGRVRPIGEKMEAAFFIWTSRYLKRHGYHHYEVSNFSLGQENMCRHNRKYWRHVPYLGLGPSAHSFAAGPGAQTRARRWWNVLSLREYCRLLGEGKAPVSGFEELTSEQFDLETLDLGLRTEEGVDIGFLEHFSKDQRVLALWRKSGLVRVSEGRVRPTRKGFLVADSLALMMSK
ncbi:MAG: radical SAM family heme chaperone HemW [Syntrophobacteraceae bacterium]|nr:radical SAM family heme chaperone HemW [Syntrophobacteraceae bacterium]